MDLMSFEDKSSKVIVIGGKKQTIADVQKTYAELEFATTPGTMKIVNALANAKEPLTRDQLTELTHLSQVYIIDILTNLEKYDYVIGFHIGNNKRRLFYALTELGYNALGSKKTD